MKQRSQARTRITAMTLAIACLVSACSSTGLPLRKDPEKIRTALLAQTPIGTSSDNVFQLLQAHHYVLSQAKTGFVRRLSSSHYEEVGVTSIKADLGQYSTIPFFPTDVTGYWGFDVQGKLVDIRVTKGGDAP